MTAANPPCILATLDSESVARWWQRVEPGIYREREAVSRNRNLTRRTVKAHRLRPLQPRFRKFMGDDECIEEVWLARDEVARLKSE